MPVHVALLRGINVGGGNTIKMAELRALADELGWKHAETYIQSGNLVFEAAGERGDLEASLETGIRRRFALDIPAIVRAADEWPALVAANPFPEEAAAEANRLMLLLSKQPPAPEAAAALQERAQDGERVATAGGALWIHYANGAGRSKLAPALIDRLVGSPATARNWRTVLKLGEMLGGT
jgi:uncharacterized protein (DUF1697 family)